MQELSEKRKSVDTMICFPISYFYLQLVKGLHTS